MVYADANILVRYIVNDNDDMASSAEEAIDSGSLFVLPEVLAYYQESSLDFVL